MNWKVVIFWLAHSLRKQELSKTYQIKTHHRILCHQLRPNGLISTKESFIWSSVVFWFCTPTHTSVTKVPVLFIHHGVTTNNFIPVAGTVSGIMKNLPSQITQKPSWNAAVESFLLSKACYQRLFFLFFKWNSIKCFWKDTTAPRPHILLLCRCCLAFT